ncbi:MAG: hypothetical protein AAGF92_06745 [Myxococcota bacterium]
MSRHSNRREQRGTAFAESLIVLPAVAAVFIGVLALNALYSAKLEAKSRARRAAWLQADLAACEKSLCGGGCQQLSAIGSELVSVGASFDIQDQLESLQDNVFKSETIGVGHAEAPAPVIIGNGVSRQGAASPLVCNTRSRTSSVPPDIVAHACESGIRSIEYAGEVCP